MSLNNRFKRGVYVLRLMSKTNFNIYRSEKKNLYRSEKKTKLKKPKLFDLKIFFDAFLGFFSAVLTLKNFKNFENFV